MAELPSVEFMADEKVELLHSLIFFLFSSISGSYTVQFVTDE